MKGIKAAVFSVLAASCMAVAVFTGCGEKSIVSISKAYTEGLDDVYRITYSDGSTSDFTVSNGNASSPITINDIYEEYKKQYGDITFDEFVAKYLDGAEDNTQVVQDCLRSSVSVYAEFTKTTTQNGLFGPTQVVSPMLQIGSGIIYRMESDWTYIVTNYHVIYGDGTDQSFSDTMHIYLYGSESKPGTSGNSYVYDDYAIDCSYIGGSIDYDVAVLKASTSDIKSINSNVSEVTVADGYCVGQTAIAIGNMGGYGISATQGIVSVDNEYVILSLDGTEREYRSMRIDTAIYEGNSGGGLFNINGRLIGLTNSGAAEEQNVNYAIPVQIVTGVADNIIDGSASGYSTVRKVTLGVTVQSLNIQNRYDAVTNTSSITEDVQVTAVTGAIARSLGIQQGDFIKEIIVGERTYKITRSFQISDALLTVRAGDKLSVKVKRGGSETVVGEYTVQSADLK